MTGERLPPLDPELDALLDAERGAGAPPAASLDRVWARMAGGVVPGSAHRPSGPAPRAGASWLASHAGGVAVAAFALGGVAGAGLHARLQKAPPERIVYIERAAAPPSASAPPASSAPASAPVASPPESAAAPSPPGRAGVRAAASGLGSSKASSLAPERAVLDDARAALASGEPAKALALLETHARRFPRGQLGEEREALAVQGLVALGRGDEARARAARFRAAVPNSLFMPSVEASLSSIP